MEWNFKGKKRPIMVERLFMKDVGRAEALITIVNIVAFVRAIIQLLMRKSVDHTDLIAHVGMSPGFLDHIIVGCIDAYRFQSLQPLPTVFQKEADYPIHSNRQGIFKYRYLILQIWTMRPNPFPQSLS